MKIFVYQSRKQVGPFSLEEIRQRLLAGEFRPTHLAWHHRLAEWVPLGELAHTPHIDIELAAPPDPEASRHFANAESTRRRRVRRVRTSQNESEAFTQAEPPAATGDGEASQPPASSSPMEERRSPRGSRERRVRKMRASDPRTWKEPEGREISLWKLIKDFFQN